MSLHSTSRAIMEEAIAAQVFPGGVVHLSQGELLVHEAVGTLGYKSPFQTPVSTDTLYDLASVTKIYTLATALIVLRAAKIPLETPLHHFFPEFPQNITLEHLMSHRSGISFPIQRLDQTPATAWLNHIATAPLNSAPGESVLYSCTNYFLLAQITEQVGTATLDELMIEHFLTPLHLHQTTFAPTGSQQVAPTEENQNGFWQGIVHDEAARSWRQQTGRCAGNAGLFATAADVASFAQIWMDEGAGILHPEDIAQVFAARYPENEHWRSLGFQIDAPFYMSPKAPPSTAGHLGFTGPSLVLNTDTQHIAVVLNNRVHPTRSGPNRLPYHRRIAANLFEVTGKSEHQK